MKFLFEISILFSSFHAQGDCAGGAEMGHKETHQLKNFKLEVERKKLDLPAQKNLLTNYFCIHTLPIFCLNILFILDLSFTGCLLLPNCLIYF